MENGLGAWKSHVQVASSVEPKKRKTSDFVGSSQRQTQAPICVKSLPASAPLAGSSRQGSVSANAPCSGDLPCVRRMADGRSSQWAANAAHDILGT